MVSCLVVSGSMDLIKSEHYIHMWNIFRFFLGRVNLCWIKKKGNKYLNLLCPLLIIAIVLLIAPHLAPTVLPRLQSYSTISRYWSFNSMPGHFSAIDVSWHSNLTFSYFKFFQFFFVFNFYIFTFNFCLSAHVWHLNLKFFFHFTSNTTTSFTYLIHEKLAEDGITA